ncbi:MFS transporter [Pendulispora brunnea]|uniref:MFS transporter n=1 Tax=Pendulispora brunnea TaxID=2905690 RepID=A0ABZ2KNX2_9BACT
MGSSITGFCLGLWFYQHTGSVTQYAAVRTATLLPSVLALPLAGIFVDRYDRQKLLIATELCAGVCSLILAALFVGRVFTVWTVLPTLALASVCGTFQSTALSAILVVLVAPQQRTRANALLQLGLAVSEIVAPLAASALSSMVTLASILAFDVASFACAAVVIVFVRIPKSPRSGSRHLTAAFMWHEFGRACNLIRRAPGLIGLLGLGAVVNLNIGFVTTLVVPLIMSVSDEMALGRTSSAAAVGFLVGSVTMTLWGGPKRAIWGILAATALQGGFMFCASLYVSSTTIAAAAFGIYFTIPFVSAGSQAIWQQRIPIEAQGRIFSIRSTAAVVILALASVIAGPLADRVFEPSMRAGSGTLASVFGPYIGIGPGRGIALMVALLAIFTVFIAVVAWISPSVRQVGNECSVRDA